MYLHLLSIMIWLICNIINVKAQQYYKEREGEETVEQEQVTQLRKRLL